MSESEPFGPPPRQSSQNTCLIVGLIVAAVVVVAMVVLLVVGAFVFYLLASPDVKVPLVIDERLPAVNLEPLTGDGQPIEAGDLEGRVVLLNMWATWCPPCQREFPHIVELYKEFSSNDDFLLICLSTDGDDVDKLRTNTEDFLKQRDADIPTYTDPTGATIQGIMQVTGERGIPQTLVIDRNGTVRDSWVGYRAGSERDMKRRIEELLSE